jgi:hypothetical protein
VDLLNGLKLENGVMLRQDVLHTRIKRPKVLVELCWLLNGLES